MSRVSLESTYEHFINQQESAGKKTIWATLIISLFFIANGSMLVYESEFNSASLSTNTGLIVVGSITLFFTFVLLVFLTYAGRSSKFVFSIGFLIMMMLGVMFGASVGVISVINGVDVPNDTARNTLGWVFGGITAGIAVISAFVCLLYLGWIYWRKREVRESIRQGLQDKAQKDVLEAENQTSSPTPPMMQPGTPQASTRRPPPAFGSGKPVNAKAPEPPPGKAREVLQTRRNYNLQRAAEQIEAGRNAPNGSPNATLN